MALHSILCLSKSVVAGIGGRLVLPNTRFRQAVSCIQLLMKCLTVMGESSLVPNIFPVPVTRTRLLQAIHGLEIPTNLSQKTDNRRL